MSLMAGLLGIIELSTALFLLAVCGMIAWYVGSALVTERASQRWCAAAIVGTWLLTVLFYLLASFSAFRRPVVVPLFLLLGVAAYVAPGRRTASARARQDLHELTTMMCARRDGLLVTLCGLVAAILAVRGLRGFVLPPLAWDALTYHLLKAGRWVQQGGWTPEIAPDAWSYYEFFPPGGDLLWAWAMLPGRSDALLAPAGVLVWLACLLGGYGAARVLDATPRTALATGLGIAMMPCVINFLTSAYVNGLVLALLLLGLAFVLRTFQSRAIVHMLLAATALGLLAGAQVSQLPLLAVGIGLMSVSLAWHRGAWTAIKALGLAALVCAPLFTGYAMTWQRTGSPFYPIPVSLAGHTIWPGNEQFVELMSGALTGHAATSVDWLLLARYQIHGIIGIHLNLGPGVIPLVLTGMVGLWTLAVGRRQPITTALLLAFTAIPIAAFLSDLAFMQRTSWSLISGRFLAPAVATLAVAGAVVPGCIADYVRWGAVAGGIAYAIPRRFTDVDWTVTGALAPWVAAAAAIVAVAYIAGRRRQRDAFGFASGTIAAGLALAYGAAPVRDALRYESYRAASLPIDRSLYDLHPLDSTAVAWSLWERLDDGQPRRIAYAAGWDGAAGHTWYRYPLLGRRLQNVVVYVPPTRDASVIDYRHAARLAQHADFLAWLARLVQQRIEVVVIGRVGGPELPWMQQHRTVFVPMEDPHLSTQAFQVSVAAAEALLAKSESVELAKD